MASPSSRITFPRCLKTKKLYKGAFSNFFFLLLTIHSHLDLQPHMESCSPLSLQCTTEAGWASGKWPLRLWGVVSPPLARRGELGAGLLSVVGGLRWRSKQLGCLLWGSAIGVRASAGQCLDLGGFPSHIWPLWSCRPSRAPLSPLAVPPSVFLTHGHFSFFCSAQGKSEVLLWCVGTGQVLGACCCGQTAGWWDQGGQRMLSCWVY